MRRHAIRLSRIGRRAHRAMRRKRRTRRYGTTETPTQTLTIHRVPRGKR